MAKKIKTKLDDTDNSFTGTGAMDVVLGKGGNDNLSGGNGNDVLKGGDGNDTLRGGKGDDKLVGGAGDDNMLGGQGDDTLSAKAGNDIVNGGAGDDVVILSGNFADATVTRDGENFIIVTAAGTVTVSNVELFKFADQTVSADDLDGDDGITLTEEADTVTGHIINAPRGFTPGGTDQVNTLNDDDVLTGTTATDDILNFDYVNDADTGDTNIQPKMSGIEIIDIDVRLDSDATLDFQDSSGVEEIRVGGIDDFVEFTADNIQDAAGTLGGAGLELSVNDSNADDAGVSFYFDGDAVDGDDDSVNLTLNDVDLWYVDIDDENGDSGSGIEHVNLASTGDANELDELWLEDAEDLTVTGDQDLTLGYEQELVRGTGQVEAIAHFGGLMDVAGSLTKIDASALTGDLDIVVGEETIADLDGTSGTKVDFSIVTGSGDDTIRLASGMDTKGDTIDGGLGANTLQVYDSVTAGTISNMQLLDIRGGLDNDGLFDDDTITVDASLFTGLTDVWIRNESSEFGQTQAGENLDVILNKVTADLAQNISLQHGVTGANGIDDLYVEVNLAVATGTTDTVALTIADKLDDEDRGVNTDPRFNFELNAAAVENITIDDIDSESNTVDLDAIASHTGTLTVTGGQVGKFLNFDPEGLIQYDLSGFAVDGEDFQDGGPNALVFKTISASTFVGDFIARIGTVNVDITTGTGNDTIIFDAVDLHAGLSISDKVNLGAGNDTVAIDGSFLANSISIGASEWTNFKGVDNIRLVDNDAQGYKITLTNELVDQTDGGSVINIINDLDPDSDGTPFDTESDAIIDARSLNSSNFFTYDGAEVGPTGAGFTVFERFILSDANINGGSTIDGGYEDYINTAFVPGTTDPLDLPNGNQDILEIRNAAVVTVGDLAKISNVGTLEFTNDTAAVQSSVLDLDNATIDSLVNSAHIASAAEPEILLVRAVGNALVPGAGTEVLVDLAGVDFTKFGVVLQAEVGGSFELQNNIGQVTFLGSDDDDVFFGGNGNDRLYGGLGDDIFGTMGGDDYINLSDDSIGVNPDGFDDTIVFGVEDAGGLVSVDAFENITFGGDVGDDVLDLTNLGLTTINYTAVALTEGSAMGSDVLSFVTPAAATGDNIIYVDVNNDNVFNLANDLVITLEDAGDILWGTNIVL